MSYKDKLLTVVKNNQSVEDYVYQPLEILGYERESINLYLELLYLVRMNTDLSDRYFPIPEQLREMWEAHISLNLSDYLIFSNAVFGKVVNYVGMPEHENYDRSEVLSLIGDELPALRSYYESYTNSPFSEF